MSKWFISIIAFLIFAGIGEHIYLCHVTKVFCFFDKTEVVVEDKVIAPIEVEENLAPIMFNWNDPLAMKTKLFTPEFREGILTNNTVDKVLEITGYYSPNEVNNTKEENLGFARAARIAELFPEIPKERVVLLSRKVGSPDSDPGKRFEYSEMEWVFRADDKPDEATKVVTLADREIIYFPYNSAERIKNPDLEVYLQNLADQLKASGETVTLTGHTDNKGEDAYNEKLARKRANDVKDLLMAQGVTTDKVIVDSMGEREPISSNATEQGRARNRRVEVVRSN